LSNFFVSMESDIEILSEADASMRKLRIFGIDDREDEVLFSIVDKP